MFQPDANNKYQGLDKAYTLVRHATVGCWRQLVHTAAVSLEHHKPDTSDSSGCLGLSSIYFDEVLVVTEYAI